MATDGTSLDQVSTQLSFYKYRDLFYLNEGMANYSKTPAKKNKLKMNSSLKIK